jgi:transposase
MPRASTYRLPAITDREWQVISSVIPRPKAGPSPRYDREIVSAFCYAKAAGCSYECLPPGYPNSMSVRTRIQRWRRADLLPKVLQAAAPAIERIRSNYWDHLRWLSSGKGWKLNREKDDPELVNLPRFARSR